MNFKTAVSLYIIASIFWLFLAGCTISMTMNCDNGEGSMSAEETQSTSAKIDPNINIPAI